MIKRLKSLNAQFLVIALSLVVISTVLGLSAYITGESRYDGQFRVAAGSELGFSITGEKFDSENLRLVVPGDTVDVNAVATVSENTPLYVFVELDIPAGCEKVDFYDGDWHAMSSDSNIYYYGTNGSLAAMGGENIHSVPILRGLTVNQNTQSGESFSFSITGYAIQTTNLGNASTPETVFNLIKDSSSTTGG